MIKRILITLLIVCVPLFSKPWGFFAHKRINRLAVFTLPTELMGFYKAHIEYITEHAVDPDKRRYAIKEEAPRHYIDIDHYGEDPFKTMPRKWNDAVAKFTEDTLQAYGIVPWHVNVMYYRLVRAFREKDLPYILKVSADLGHYIEDAHVPLHTTKNYNGQLTGQKGIHGFWESRLPELFADDYDNFVGRAEFIRDPLEFIWDAVEQSHAAVDSVLLFERQLTEQFPTDQKYSFEERGASTMRVYSRDFSAEYHVMMQGMVERRFRKAVYAVGSFWYSAWLEAGKPTLDEELDPVDMEKLEQEAKELEAEYRGNAIKGREHDH